MDRSFIAHHRQIVAENIKEWMDINKEEEERKRESILRFGLAHAHTAG